jgi:hypothetical protein
MNVFGGSTYRLDIDNHGRSFSHTVVRNKKFLTEIGVIKYLWFTLQLSPENNLVFIQRLGPECGPTTM